MPKLTGGGAVARTLEAEGVEVAFGVVGSTLLPVYDALIDGPMRLIAPRGEDGAGHMADAYARVSGKPGVLLTTVGPGAANAVSAMGEAYNESWPLLHITTQTTTPYLDREKGVYHDGPNQRQIFQSVSGWDHRIGSVGEIPEAIHEAFVRMKTGRPRPVFLEIPADLLRAEDTVAIPAPANGSPPPVNESEVRDALPLITKARRPVIWAGGGAVKSGAGDEVRQLAERLQAPVFATNASKGIVSDDHPLAVGNLLTMSSIIEDEVLAPSDLVIAVGTRFSQRATKQWSVKMPADIIHIDIDRGEFGRNYAAKATVEGDAHAILQAMLTSLDGDGFKAAADRAAETRGIKERALQALRQKHPDEFQLLEEVRRVMPRDTIVAAQSILGHWCRFALECYAPASFLFANTYGSMGFAFHAALGAKAACPDRPVVAFCGDGGFMMGCGELATLMTYKLNMPVVIFNNAGFAILRARQVRQYQRHIGTDVENPDFMKLADSFAMKAARVKDFTEVAPRLEQALADGGPWLIEVPIEFEGYRPQSEDDRLFRPQG
jgi:acetolactate synthase-1/2/3 large subunit